MVKLLAIDQGSVKCGWAYLKDGEVQQSGVLKLKGEDRKARYGMLIETLQNMIADEAMTHMAIEDVYLKRSGFSNPKTMKIMGETRGIITAVGIMYNLKILDVNPSDVTKFLGINTRTQNKKLVTQQYVKALLNAEVYEDEADAVIIGLIAHNRIKYAKLEEKAGTTSKRKGKRNMRRQDEVPED